MNNNIDEIKEELKDICRIYINIMEKLRDENQITKDLFDECTDRKYLFLDE